MKQYRYKAIRYYLKWSSADYVDLYKEVIKEAGGKNPRVCCQYGWSNQPKVVTWAGDAEINKAIDEALSGLLPFDHIILPVDW